MLSLNVPAELAYFVFVMWVFAIFIAIWWYKPQYREQMNFMSFWGGIGGVCIAQAYRMDFWQPLSIFSFSLGPFLVTVEHYVFGGAFTGIVTVLPQLFGRSVHLEPEVLRTSQWKRKVLGLTLVVLVGVAAYFGLRLYTIGATILAFLSSIFFLYLGKRHLLKAVLWGGSLTLLLYVGIVGAFLLVVGNRSELATQLCQYYVTHGVMGTGIALCFWAFAFGTFVVPLYPWGKNQRFVSSRRE